MNLLDINWIVYAIDYGLNSYQIFNSITTWILWRAAFDTNYMSYHTCFMYHFFASRLAVLDLGISTLCFFHTSCFIFARFAKTHSKFLHCVHTLCPFVWQKTHLEFFPKFNYKLEQSNIWCHVRSYCDGSYCRFFFHKKKIASWQTFSRNPSSEVIQQIEKNARRDISYSPLAGKTYVTLIATEVFFSITPVTNNLRHTCMNYWT